MTKDQVPRVETEPTSDPGHMAEAFERTEQAGKVERVIRRGVSGLKKSHLENSLSPADRLRKKALQLASFCGLLGILAPAGGALAQLGTTDDENRNDVAVAWIANSFEMPEEAYSADFLTSVDAALREAGFAGLDQSPGWKPDVVMDVDGQEPPVNPLEQWAGVSVILSNDSNANVREEPSASSVRLDTFLAGTPIDVLEAVVGTPVTIANVGTSDAWLAVQLGQRRGYISALLVDNPAEPIDVTGTPLPALLGNAESRATATAGTTTQPNSGATEPASGATQPANLPEQPVLPTGPAVPDNNATPDPRATPPATGATPEARIITLDNISPDPAPEAPEARIITLDEINPTPEAQIITLDQLTQSAGTSVALAGGEARASVDMTVMGEFISSELLPQLDMNQAIDITPEQATHIASLAGLSGVPEGGVMVEIETVAGNYPELMRLLHLTGNERARRAINRLEVSEQPGIGLRALLLSQTRIIFFVEGLSENPWLQPGQIVTMSAGASNYDVSGQLPHTFDGELPAISSPILIDMSNGVEVLNMGGEEIEITRLTERNDNGGLEPIPLGISENEISGVVTHVYDDAISAIINEDGSVQLPTSLEEAQRGTAFQILSINLAVPTPDGRTIVVQGVAVPPAYGLQVTRDGREFGTIHSEQVGAFLSRLEPGQQLIFQIQNTDGQGLITERGGDCNYSCLVFGLHLDGFAASDNLGHIIEAYSTPGTTLPGQYSQIGMSVIHTLAVEQHFQ